MINVECSKTYEIFTRGLSPFLRPVVESRRPQDAVVPLPTFFRIRLNVQRPFNGWDTSSREKFLKKKNIFN